MEPETKSLAKNRANYASMKSYSIEHGYTARRRSLIEDAKFEHNILHAEHVLESVKAEDTFFENEKELETKNKLMISVENQILGLKTVLDSIQDFDCVFEHVESRPSKKKRKSAFEIYIELRSTYSNFIKFINKLKQSKQFSDVIILNSEEETTVNENIFIPMSIWDLDKCNHLNIKYEPDIDSRHPGFSDMEYRKRRQEIADIAFAFKHGDRIPKVVYAENELKTWSLIYHELKALYPTHACRQHIEAIKNLESNGIYGPDFIPQLEDVSNYLKKKSGFQLRPVAGLLSARDFLASLAFRVFQCTQYIRHSSSPLHSPEPDCVHELLGHVPLLSNKNFADFSQEIGLASLGASEEDIIKLSTVSTFFLIKHRGILNYKSCIYLKLYWFTVEFGLCKEGTEVRAYGAGLLSAFGELKHALSGTPELKDFEPFSTSVQEYQDEDYQPLYFIAKSFDKANEQLRTYSKSIKKPFKVRYDPFTQTIGIVDSLKAIQEIKKEIKTDFDLVVEYLDEIKLIEY